MNKTFKIYLLLLVVVFGAIIVMDYNSPKPIDWTPSYSINDKIPYGLYVFNQELPNFFKNQKITPIRNTPYEYFGEKYNYDSLVNNYKVNGTFISINENSSLDEQSVNELFSFVSHGNTVFLSGKILPNSLLDSLHLKMNSEFKFKDSIYNWIANSKVSSKKYKLMEGVSNNFFSKIDTLNTTVLGCQNGDSTRINFIKVQYRNGSFLLHTQPTAFTNFHLLKKDHFEYAEQVLSYLPKTDLFWYTKNQNGALISDSPMRYILSQPALKWAWYLFLIGMVIFILFNAKRKQRIVPIVEPLTNTTVAFTKTIGNLYYQEGDHDTIITKKIIFFLEKIRNDYLLDTTYLNEDFIKKLHLKSGKDLAAIQKAVFLINTHRRSPHNSIEADLIAINNAIEKLELE